MTARTGLYAARSTITDSWLTRLWWLLRCLLLLLLHGREVLLWWLLSISSNTEGLLCVRPPFHFSMLLQVKSLAAVSDSCYTSKTGPKTVAASKLKFEILLLLHYKCAVTSHLQRLINHRHQPSTYVIVNFEPWNLASGLLWFLRVPPTQYVRAVLKWISVFDQVPFQQESHPENYHLRLINCRRSHRKTISCGL